MSHSKNLLLIAVITASTLFCAAIAFAANGYTKGRQLKPFAPATKPGDYTWHPEVSPAGPVVIVVSLPHQLMYVYRNGVRIGRSTVSTGAKGHQTPTGVFTVLQKKVDHESSIYKGAKMPHMQRLSWTGICMHAGNLPGYPASHGCVRLPEDFAEKLYSVTSNGSTVIIADNNSGLGHTTTPGLLFAGHKGETAPRGTEMWKPEKSSKGPVSVLISAADGAVYIYRNGVEIGRAPIAKLGRVGGTYVYSADAVVDSQGERDWLSVASTRGRAPNLKDFFGKADVDPEFLAKARAVIAPGTSLILTNEPVSKGNHSGSGYNILTASS